MFLHGVVSPEEPGKELPPGSRTGATSATSQRPLLSRHCRSAASPYPSLRVTTLDKVELVLLFRVGKLAEVTLRETERDSKPPLFLKLVFRSVVPTPTLRPMLWHQVMRPNERGWRGEEAESGREDLLYICTLQVPTREKGGCEEMRGGIERASWCIGFRGERNS